MMKRLVHVSFLVAAGAAVTFATVLKVANGTIFNGTIVAENKNSYTLKVGESNISIRKSMVIEKDGVAVNTKRSALPNTTNVESSQSAASAASKEWVVTLRNGTSFQGTKVSENQRILVFRSQGQPVTIFKNVIASIDSGGAQQRASQPVAFVERSQTDQAAPMGADASRKCMGAAKPVDAPMAARFSVSSMESTVEVPSPHAIVSVPMRDSVSQPIISSSLQIKGAVVPFSSKQEQIDSSEQVAVLPSAPAEPKESLFVAETGTMHLVAPPVVTAIVVPLPPPLTSASTKPTTLPVQTAGITGGKKTADWQSKQSPPKPNQQQKRTICLSNGTKFVGTIAADHAQVLLVATESATLPIFKRSIKSIDGIAYTGSAGSSVDSQPQMPQQRLLHSPQKSVVVVIDLRPEASVALQENANVALLSDSLHASSAAVRSRTARTLGAMGQWAMAARGPLTELLSDTVGAAKPLPLWIDSATRAELLPPGVEAARALARLGKGGIQALLHAAATPDRLRRLRALFGLGDCVDSLAQAALQNASSDPDEQIRVVALSGLQPKRARALYVTAFSDKSSMVRCAAVTLFGMRSAADEAGLLTGPAHDKNSIVRSAAADALGTIASPEAIMLLTELAGDNDMVVRQHAAHALGETKTAAAVEPLLTAISDNSEGVRIASIAGLTAIHDSRAIPALYAAAKDKRPQVRTVAQQALRQFTEIPMLIASLDDTSETVRANVAYLLWLMTGTDKGVDKAAWQAWYTGEKAAAQKRSSSNK